MTKELYFIISLYLFYLCAKTFKREIEKEFQEMKNRAKVSVGKATNEKSWKDIKIPMKW